jgi:hypothetical protein
MSEPFDRDVLRPANAASSRAVNGLDRPAFDPTNVYGLDDDELSGSGTPLRDAIIVAAAAAAAAPAECLTRRWFDRLHDVMLDHAWRIVDGHVDERRSRARLEIFCARRRGEAVAANSRATRVRGGARARRQWDQQWRRRVRILDEVDALLRVLAPREPTRDPRFRWTCTTSTSPATGPMLVPSQEAELRSRVAFEAAAAARQRATPAHVEHASLAPFPPAPSPRPIRRPAALRPQQMRATAPLPEGITTVRVTAKGRAARRQLARLVSQGRLEAYVRGRLAREPELLETLRAGARPTVS